MLEPVSYKDVMDSLSKRLEYGLKKARIFPELLTSCETTARRLNMLKALKRMGAELYLAPKDEHSWKFWHVHPIPEEKRKLFLTCKRFSLHHFALDRQLYARTWVRHRGRDVLVHLGEWKPFVEFTKEPLEMTCSEFMRVCREIQRYRATMGEYAEGFRVAEEFLREDRPVLLFAEKISRAYRYVADMRYYTEYSEARVELTEEDRAMLDEQRRMEEAGLREQAKAFGELIARGRLTENGGGFMVFEVSPEDVEKALNVPIKGVAKKAYVVKSEYSLYGKAGVHASTPLSYLHGLRYLRDAGVDASLVRRRGYGEVRSGIQIYKKFITSYFYAVIIVPKSVHQLPPIKLAKVIKSPKTIVVVES